MNTVQIHIKANSYINPNKNYQALPVVIRIYQLRNKLRFMQADFYELWQHGNITLGKDLIRQSDFILIPDEKKIVRFSKNKKARYIGLVAIFRKPTVRYWRVIKKISSSYLPTKISISVIGDKILEDYA